jgi:hypothetical protein
VVAEIGDTETKLTQRMAEPLRDAEIRGWAARCAAVDASRHDTQAVMGRYLRVASPRIPIAGRRPATHPLVTFLLTPVPSACLCVSLLDSA